MILEVTKRHITGSTHENNPIVAAFFEETHIETTLIKSLDGYNLLEKNCNRYWAIKSDVEWNDELYDTEWRYIGDEIEPVTIELREHKL